MKSLQAVVAVAALAAAIRVQGPPPIAGQARDQAWRANNQGVAQLEQYRYDAAARSFRAALQAAPDLSVARLNLAIALFYAGRAADAAIEARAAAQRLPEEPSAHYVTGLVAKAENRLDDAATAFGRVLQLDPDDPATKVQLGQIHLQQRRYADALRLFDEALAAEPYNVTAAYNAALAMTRGGRTEEGRQAMRRFEALRDSPYGVTYSQTYLAQGRYAEATVSTGAEPDLVSPAPPAVRFSDVTNAWLPLSVAPGPAAASGGSVTLFDADGDGHLDLFEIGRGGAHFFRHDGNRLVDETTRAGFEAARGVGAVAGDYDNDGRPDLLVLRDDGLTLFHQQADRTFEDVTSAAGLPASGAAATTAAFVDVDHDGDLDLVVAGGPVVRLFRNNGNGTFTDITAAAGMAAPLEQTMAVAPTDFDNRRDIDVLIADAHRAPLLYRNMRDGSFKDAAREVGLPAAGNYSALAAGDVNKDRYPDFFFGRRDEPGTLALSDGRGRFRLVAAPEASRGAIAAQFVDYDNDGLLDLLTLSPERARLFRNIGGGRWSETTDQAGLATLTPGIGSSFQSMAVGDLDADGDADVVIRDAAGRLRIWRNDGGNRHASINVRLIARVSNRSGLGAKVELRAGSLRQLLETSSASPPIAPADLLFGLGMRSAADGISVLWPSGILQAETSIGTAAAGRPKTITIAELDRKPSSCPYLFTWNGDRFEFVTDFMGGGEIGDWEAPGVWDRPDPDEYVRIRGDQLRPRDGRYEIRVTNELEEALFVDRLQLVAIDHPADVDVFPNEGLKEPPRPSFRLFSVRGARPPARAYDEHGHDVLARIAARDRRYPDDFALSAIRGYAVPHALTLDLSSVPEPSVLLLTGWTDYAFSSDNVAASQSGTEMAAPSLQVKDQGGTWRTVIDDVGFPVGRPQTVAVDLKGKFLSDSRDVRIVTSMRIYWDQILVGSAVARGPTRVTRLDPIRADLRWRGYSAETSTDGREPFGFDYDHVSTAPIWKSFVGRYTREGDVRPLLLSVDDMFVVSKPGDEIALSFDARSLPSLEPGWTRTFLLYAFGYSKEMNPRSADVELLAPLPFHAMPGYPYGPPEHYPLTRARREYLEHYNTRVVTRVAPSIDALIAGAQR